MPANLDDSEENDFPPIYLDSLSFRQGNLLKLVRFLGVRSEGARDSPPWYTIYGAYLLKPPRWSSSHDHRGSPETASDITSGTPPYVAVTSSKRSRFLVIGWKCSPVAAGITLLRRHSSREATEWGSMRPKLTVVHGITDWLPDEGERKSKSLFPSRLPAEPYVLPSVDLMSRGTAQGQREVGSPIPIGAARFEPWSHTLP